MFLFVTIDLFINVLLKKTGYGTKHVMQHSNLNHKVLLFSLKYSRLDICKESLETASNEVMPNCIVLTKPLIS